MLFLKGLVELFSFFSITGQGINLDYHDIEWFALETNRDHSVVFEIASKYLPITKKKLEVVKQMARVNINILGISELKWTGMGEFNSDDNYIYYCGQESLRGNGVDIMVKKRAQNAVLRCNLKNNRMICLFPRQTIQYHSNPSLCPNQ